MLQSLCLLLSKTHASLFFIFAFTLPFISQAQSGIDHWETAVFNNDTWSYRTGTSAPPANWMQTQFNDSTWLTGQGGFGYGDGDDNTIIPSTMSLCIRIPFNITDTSKVKMAMLHADYDDGFIAYLNGTEIARSNFGPSGTTLAYNSATPGIKEAQLYQGGVPEAYPIFEALFKQLVNNNQNVLAIQINNSSSSSSDLSSNFFLSLAITDNSQDYSPTPTWFTPPLIASDLPLVIVNTGNQQIVDEPKIDANMRIVDNGPGLINYAYNPGNDYDGHVGIEIRGTSSQAFDKKNYGFETRDASGNNNNVSILGMPSENDWILHGPYSDKSLIRNALTFQIGRDMMDYASRTRFCELVINNEYRGIYLMMEKIKRDNNRVDIANLKPNDITGDELTGGYVIQIDRDDPDISGDGWYSPLGSSPFYAFHHPNDDQLVPAQKTYIENWITDFEIAIGRTGYDTVFEDYIDVESFIDYFLINEMVKHIDAFKLSFYMYKQKDSDGGKLHMGPIWDFNLSFGNFDFGCSPDPNGWIYPCTSRAFWLDKIVSIPSVQDRMYCRWQELRQQTLSTTHLMNSIDSMVLELGPAVDRNFDKFPILGVDIWPNDFVGNTHLEEINFMKNWLTQRLTWMDNNMFGDPNVNCNNLFSLLEASGEAALSVYPNPFNDQVTFSINEEGQSDGEVFIHDLQGKLIKQFKPAQEPIIDLSNLSSGMYYYRYRNGQNVIQTGKLLKQ